MLCFGDPAKQDHRHCDFSDDNDHTEIVSASMRLPPKADDVREQTAEMQLSVGGRKENTESDPHFSFGLAHNISLVEWASEKLTGRLF
jgi:hypothetical protein